MVSTCQESSFLAVYDFACFETWDVRLMAFEALALLRQQAPFPHRDAGGITQMFRTLGDEYGIVQGEAVALIQTLKPDDEVLHFVLSQMTRVSVRAGQSSNDVRVSWGPKLLTSLLRSDSPVPRERIPFVKSVCTSSLLDDPSADPWILECLSDSVASVREQAIRTIGSLDFIEEADKIEHLLHDPDPDVRLQTLYALSNTDLLEPKHLEVALADSSPDVLRVARKYQADPHQSQDKP